MAQRNPIDPYHRLDHLSAGKFFEAYARLRWHLYNDVEGEHDVFWYRGYCEGIEADLARMFDLPAEGLKAAVREVGSTLVGEKDAKDGDESPVG